ncbi:MAG: GDP-mannose 4,6-dehydratase [Bacteroidota bacterium]
MKALLAVSGAGGFIGSHLVEYLLATGHPVRALVHYHSNGNWGWLDPYKSKSHPQLEVIAGDIRDPFWVEQQLREVHTVFHLAALIAIPFSYQAPASYVSTNVLGSINLLQAARKHQCERVILMSTSEVYGTAQQIPINEQHPVRGQSPYSASKIGMEAQGEAFYRSFDLPVSVVRPFNNYGPRQSLRGVLPSILLQLLRRTPRLELGDLRPSRDFLYVKDCVAALYAIAQSKATIGQTLNIATGQEVSIESLAKTLIDLLNPETPIVQDPQRIRPDKSEVFRLCGDASRLQELTSWQAQYNLKAGLTETIAWFREAENLKHYPPQSYQL